MYKYYENKEKIICNPEYPDHQVNFGLLMKEHRAALKITQGTFADMMNVTRNTVINWEANKSKPDYNMLPKICKILGIQLNDIFGLPYEAPPTTLEQHVIKNLRALSPYGQRVLENMSDALVEEEAAIKDKKMMEDFGLFLVRPGMAAAGVGDYVPDEAPTYTFLRKNTINAKADGIVKVDGDSMEPVYHNGDYVYYREAYAACPGEDVIVDTDEGAVIKRMASDRTLYSVNPDLPYPMKHEDNELIIRGVVLGTVHSSDRASNDEIPVLEELFGDEIKEFFKER